MNRIEYDSGPMHDGCGGECRETREYTPTGEPIHRIRHADGSQTINGQRIGPNEPEYGSIEWQRKMWGG